jgi:hypothetical protein
MGAKSGCSKAALVLKTAVLKPSVECTHFQEVLAKLFVYCFKQAIEHYCNRVKGGL